MICNYLWVSDDLFTFQLNLRWPSNQLTDVPSNPIITIFRYIQVDAVHLVRNNIVQMEIGPSNFSHSAFFVRLKSNVSIRHDDCHKSKA